MSVRKKVVLTATPPAPKRQSRTQVAQRLQYGCAEINVRGNAASGGFHAWNNWRDYLNQFASLLSREAIHIRMARAVTTQNL